MPGQADSLGLVAYIDWRDRMTAEVRRAQRTIGDLGLSTNRTADLMQRDTQRAERGFMSLGNTIRPLRSLLTSLGISAGGLALARTLGLTDVTSEAREAEHALAALGNVGGLSPEQTKAYGEQLLKVGQQTNQWRKDLLGGMSTLVAAGLEAETAMGFMPIIGKTATATQASVNDLARSTFDVHTALGVALKDIPQALEIMTAAGKEGRFELRDMATNYSSMTADAKALYMQGLPAVAQLSAALQIAMKGAAEPAEAANNFRNFLNKLTSELTVKNFADFGVDLKAELDKALMTGADPIEHFLKVIIDLTKGDQFILNQLFRDLQVTSFLKPMIQNLDEYRRIRDTVMRSHGAIDADFARMMATTNEQFKQLRMNLAATIMPGVNAFLRGFKWLLDKINNSAVLLYGTLGVVGGIGVLGLVSSLGFLRWGLSQTGLGMFQAKAQADQLSASLLGVAASAGTATASLASVGAAGTLGHGLMGGKAAVTAGMAGGAVRTGGLLAGLGLRGGALGTLGAVGRVIPYVGLAALALTLAPTVLDIAKTLAGGKGDPLAKITERHPPLDLERVFRDRGIPNAAIPASLNYDYSVTTVHNHLNVDGGDPKKVEKAVKRASQELISRSPQGAN